MMLFEQILSEAYSGQIGLLDDVGIIVGTVPVPVIMWFRPGLEIEGVLREGDAPRRSEAEARA